ncbi:MAG TPA: aminotransferase class V-fold PLP-dependent enzyme [Solirubrobacter sp.]|nr:aminotransferase class V-fold PLP-dependent enzyme [Solirubrobacter sp.]
MTAILPPNQLVGADIAVPCADGRMRRYVNLDYAASTPVMGAVWQAVEAFVPFYSSVHRGTGAKSRISTDAYEKARGSVARFVGAPDGSVVFVRNTTEAINVLAAALPPGTKVLSSPVEHHANMLPWREHDLRLLPFPESPEQLLADAERMLDGVDVLAVTGASNVTGEVWPLRELAALAHAHGAELFVDAAQLAPHRAIDMVATGIDHLALSGHKLYAPFGAGALVSRKALTGSPLLRGGGAIKLVTVDDVIWADAPDRFEAGSPNVIGAVALAAACDALDMAEVEAEERILAARLHAGLATIDGLTPYALWPGHPDRVGVASFNLAGYKHCQLAELLSDRYAIGVRHGCFCAHPLLTRLLCVPDAEAQRLHDELRAGKDPELPGAVRASLGLGTTAEDIDALIAALTELS